jgi:hypothetical protein
LREALRKASHAPASVRAAALQGAGALAYSQGDYQAAEEFVLQSLELYRQLGDDEEIINALNNLANLAGVEGD